MKGLTTLERHLRQERVRLHKLRAARRVLSNEESEELYGAIDRGLLMLCVQLNRLKRYEIGFVDGADNEPT